MGEADPAEPNWQQSFNGSDYDRLLEIEQQCDSWGLFWAQTAVGSESWEVRNGEWPTQNVSLTFPLQPSCRDPYFRRRCGYCALNTLRSAEYGSKYPGWDVLTKITCLIGTSMPSTLIRKPEVFFFERVMRFVYKSYSCLSM